MREGKYKGDHYAPFESLDPAPRRGPRPEKLYGLHSNVEPLFPGARPDQMVLLASSSIFRRDLEHDLGRVR